MKKLEIKPFDDFWLNCGFNNNFSILTSYNKKYKELAYLNGYKYQAYNEWSPKHIALNNSSRIQDDIIGQVICKEYFLVEYSEKNANNLINMLHDNNIMIRVDLYNWLPNSSSWHKEHNYHYSLLSDYDEAKQEIVIIDDDNRGYGVKSIPYKRFLKCINDEESNITGYIIHIKNEIDYELNMNDVLYHANILLDNIDFFYRENDFWKVQVNEKGENLCKFYAFEVFKIENRQKANLELVKCLYDKKYINKNIDESLIKEFIYLKIEWERIKNILLKDYMYSANNVATNIDKLNLLKSNCIKKEIEIWKKFKCL